MRRCRLPTAWLLLVCCLAPAVAAVAQDAGFGDPRVTEDPRELKDPRKKDDPREDSVKPGIDESLAPLQGPPLFDQLYEDKNFGALSSAMAETPWELTDYIYDLCDRWLTATEKVSGKAPSINEEAKALESKLRELARLADAGIGDTRFGAYVDSVFRMTPDDRKQRQEQVRLLAQGESILDTVATREETLLALTPLRQSLSRALLLKDFRGQSRSHTLIGRVQVLNNFAEDARASAQEAVRIGRAVRDIRSVWDGWATVMQASIRLEDYDSAKAALQEQYQLTKEIGDEVTEAQIRVELIRLDRALGKVIPNSLIIYSRRIDEPRRFPKRTL